MWIADCGCYEMKCAGEPPRTKCISYEKTEIYVFFFSRADAQEIKWTMSVPRSMYLLLLPHYTHIARPILTEGILLMHERMHSAIPCWWQHTQLHQHSENKTRHERPAIEHLTRTLAATKSKKRRKVSERKKKGKQNRGGRCKVMTNTDRCIHAELPRERKNVHNFNARDFAATIYHCEEFSVYACSMHKKKQIADSWKCVPVAACPTIGDDHRYHDASRIAYLISDIRNNGERLCLWSSECGESTILERIKISQQRHILLLASSKEIFKAVSNEEKFAP